MAPGERDPNRFGIVLDSWQLTWCPAYQQCKEMTSKLPGAHFGPVSIVASVAIAMYPMSAYLSYIQVLKVTKCPTCIIGWEFYVVSYSNVSYIKIIPWCHHLSVKRWSHVEKNTSCLLGISVFDFPKTMDGFWWKRPGVQPQQNQKLQARWHQAALRRNVPNHLSVHLHTGANSSLHMCTPFFLGESSRGDF